MAAAILELMSTCTRWEGTAGALVGKLQSLSDDPKIKKLTSRGLGRLLSSKAFIQDLQAVGVVVDSYRKAGGNRERGWIISATTPPGDNPQSTGTFAAQNRSLVQRQESNGETFFNEGQKADNGEMKTSQTSQTSQTPINPDSQGGTLFGTLSENVPKTSLLCPADNVQNVPPPEVPTGAASGKSNPHEGDIRDIRDVFKTPLSGASGQSPIEKAAQKLADCFDGKVIQPDLEQWIGKNVEYQGRDYLLVDYLPVSGYCQIEGGGETLIVPCTEISKALDCPF